MIVWPGLRRFISTVQRLFNSASFYAPLTHSLVLDRGTGSPTFTRATTATFTDNEGVLRTCLAGEARFEGARRVRNLVSSSEDFSGVHWSNTTTTESASSVTLSGVASVWRLTESAGTAIHTINISVTVLASTTYIFSIHAAAGTRRRIMLREASTTGAASTFDLVSGSVVADESGGVGSISSLSGGGYRISLKYTSTTAGAKSFYVYMMEDGSAGNAQSSYAGDTGKYVDIGGAQLEDITGRADQTTPSEYVSVGVTSAPYYHGSMVDGVKCFATDLSGNLLPQAYTYDAVSLNGVAGTYVSTPDSVANSITGDIDIRVKAALTDWTPATSMFLTSKRNGASGEFAFLVNAGGALQLFWYGAGAVFTNAISSVAPTVVDGSAMWLRATRSVANLEVKFYTSADGVTWTQLGTTQSFAAYTQADTAIQVAIGADGDGSNGPLSGKIYAAQIYNGINGTLAVDFDASRYAGGSTLTGSTGETWTLQGNAVIHPTNSPMLGYVAEGARTNLCPYSQSIAAGFTFSGTCTGTDNVGIYAGIPFTRISNATGGVSYSTISYTGNGTKAFSCLLKKDGAVTGTYSVGLYDNSASVVRGYVTATIAADGGMTFAANGGCTVTGSRELADGVWELQGTVAGIVASNANIYYANFAVGTATSCLVSAMQTENASFPSTYIATTTIAVARNADVLTYSSSGNIDGTKGWCYAEVNLDFINAATNNWMVTRDNGSGILYSNGVDGHAVIYDNVNAAIKSGIGTFVDTQTKLASTWGGVTQSITGDGLAPASAAFDGNLNITSTIDIGANSTGNLWGTLRNLRIGQRQLSASELAAVTQ